jgi:cytochrome c peroxidase
MINDTYQFVTYFYLSYIYSMKLSTLFAVIASIVLLYACAKQEESPIVLPPEDTRPNLPAEPYAYSDLNYPDHFSSSSLQFIIGNNLANNPITNEGATLGRVLFYDKMLSVNGEKSCASCHHQEFAFTDNVRFSEGFEGGLTRRNSMSLSNTLYTRRFFWDGRSNSLQDQVLRPIEDELEMGHDLEVLKEELSKTDYYPSLFAAAFENDTITNEKIADALGQFINSMTAYSSKYDEGLENNFSNFTVEEELGRQLFFERQLNCNQCHTNAVFATNTMINNGLEPDGTDFGRAEVTENEVDNYRFRVPTLRNIELTGPYMHDGRFATLEEVVEHYNSGMSPHTYLDERLTEDAEIGGPPRQMNLTEDEKIAFVAFLKTFTDTELISAERYSDPF